MVEQRKLDGRDWPREGRCLDLDSVPVISEACWRPDRAGATQRVPVGLSSKFVEPCGSPRE